MDRDSWNNFMNELLEKYPEVQGAIFNIQRDVDERSNDFYKGQAVYTVFGYPPKAEELTSEYRSRAIRKLEKDFYAEYARQEFDPPTENPFDKVRHFYYEAEFERGDEDMNRQADKFSKVKEEARAQRELEKSGKKVVSYEFDELVSESQEKSGEKASLTEEKDQNKQDITDDKPNQRNYGEPSKLASRMEAYRNNSKTITKGKEKDKD